MMRIKVLVGLLLAVLVLPACTKANYDAFFGQIGKQVPLEEARYQLAKPEQDTVLHWHAPYKIFKNRTEFRQDSIFHEEQFNWEGLGDFLWEQYQEYKQRRKTRKTAQSFNQEDMKELYVEIADRLHASLPELAWVDIDFGQLENPAKEHPVFAPIVLLSFEANWQDKAKGLQHGGLELGVKTGTELHQDTHQGVGMQGLSHFEVLQKVYESLQGFAPSNCSALSRRTTQPVQALGNLLLSEMRFEATYADDSRLVNMESNRFPQSLSLKKS